MAALTANRPTDQFGGTESALPHRFPIPIADNVHIYQGAMIQLDSAGRANPATKATMARLSLPIATDIYP